MRTLRWLLIIILITTTGMAQAQDAAYELPALENGDTVDGLFEENIISQLYAFYATAGDNISISMTQDGDSELDPFLVLLDSEGVVLAYDDDSGGQFSALIEYTIEDDGAYFVLATSFYNNYLDGTETETSEEQAYSLSISGQNTPSDVDNADIVSLEVESLNFGDVVNGESSEDAPAAIFSFEGQAGTSVSVGVSTDGFNSVVYLFAPDGSRIAVDPSLVSLELEEDGVYLVVVVDWYFYQAIDNDGEFEGGEFSLELGN